MKPVDPSDRKAHLEQLAAAAQTTFWGYLGCQLLDMTDSRVEILLEVQEHHLNLFGILHGGVHAALLDNAMGLAAMTARPLDQIVTTNLNIHYLSPIGREPVIVAAEIVHMSRKMVTARGSVTADPDRILAIGTGSFRVIM